MPKHIEQPGSLHIKPASLNILSKPSISACSFTIPEPGTTIASVILSATVLPLTISAACLRSSIREFVHEPIKTLSKTKSDNFDSS